MGCYGIGVSRLLQAIVEHQLMKSELMVWPLAVAPFTVCIIPLYYEKVNYSRNLSVIYQSMLIVQWNLYIMVTV